MPTPLTKWLIAALTAITLAGCSNGEQQTAAKPDPVHFDSGDECHVCGMVITSFPGPKGQAFTERQQHTRKFCSTKDMFAWFLQPENENRDHTLYVHNMAETHWDHPDDTHLIDAREAWYVVGSERTGAMGPTLASFETESEATDFAAEYGGQVIGFADITLEHLNAGMAMHGMEGMDGMHDMHNQEDAGIRSGQMTDNHSSHNGH
ncbi:nitrous oxide reductase accessory protein NosL [Marinobacter shengliensis]|uniref:nitrous oxide reductase accessory protein NosL n=1 Tax=Marinobacter shengliensis TaxID=1389223 RepID=UPI000D109E27|nr:nitrous oxide reductase accessory protein NosL [Marinobacter shengliensis]PSF12545.1 nitrous oxide reductase accessory protein NosL [Marinobacter shengliensis]